MSLARWRKTIRVDRRNWPLLVRLPLWGLPSREAAWVFVWVPLILGIVCIGFGFVQPLFFAGGLMLLAALGNYLAIRWVDRNSRW